MSGLLELRRGTSGAIQSMTPAAGEVVFATDTFRLSAGDGSTAGGHPHALLAEVVTNNYEAVADANYQALSTDRSINFTTLTASRIVTLPAAASFPTGVPFRVRDNSGNCSPSMSISIATTGSDGFVGQATLGSASSIALKWPYALIELESDGVETWAVTNVKLPTRWRTAVADAAYNVVANDRLIAYTTLTAGRTVSLIAAAKFLPGMLLIIIDESGNCSAGKTITVAPNGTDTINGVNASIAIKVPFGFFALESNAVGAWTIVGQSINNGLANLPTSNPGAGSGLPWNNGGFVVVA